MAADPAEVQEWTPNPATDTAAIEALHHQRARVLRYQAKLPHELQWPEHDLVFCDEFGQPLVGRRAERVFKQLLERAVLPTTFTPRSLRHSTASYLTAMGVPPRVIMEIMGHSSLAMTTRYQHVMEGMLDDVADRLAQVFPAVSV